MRDLVRAREDAVIMRASGWERLGALAVAATTSATTARRCGLPHRRFIAEIRLRTQQHIAFEEYARAVDEAGQANRAAGGSDRR